jgi:hypothetical protein
VGVGDKNATKLEELSLVDRRCSLDAVRCAGTIGSTTRQSR